MVLKDGLLGYLTNNNWTNMDHLSGLLCATNSNYIFYVRENSLFKKFIQR